MIDLREQAGPNPIVAALERIIERKRQGEQDELARRLTESRITQAQQPEGMMGQIVVANGKTWLVDRRTGEKIDLGIAPPKGKVEGRAIADIINDMAKISGAAETIPEDVLGTPTIRAGLRSLEDEATRRVGQPTPRRTPLIEGEPIQLPKRVESREVTPPPKEHAAWHEVETGKRPVKGKVKMKAPDGKTYEVPRSEVEDAKKHSWKVL